MSTRRRLVTVLALSLFTLLPLRASWAADNSFTLYVPIVINESDFNDILGKGYGGLQILNLDPALDAQIVADFYPQQGGNPVTSHRPNVGPGRAANFYMGGEVSLRNGLYAAVITADRPIAAIARTDWSTGGDAAIYSHTLPGGTVSVPLVAKELGGQSSLVSIQNTDTSGPTTVEVAFFRAGVATAMTTFSREIRPGTSITLDLARDPAFSGVPGGTLGSMRVRSQGAPVAAQAFMDIAGGKGIYAYEGAPPERAAARLYAPLIRNDLAGTTGISVVNPGAGPVEVSVTYVGNPLSPACAGRRLHGGRSFTVAANDSAVFYQGNVAGLPTGDSGLPKKCVGSAIIESEGGPVMAIVNDADVTATANSPGSGSSAAYNAFSDADGAFRVALPLFRNKHAGPADLSTGIQAMNIGDAPANVAIEFKDSNGRLISISSGSSQVIAPLASYTWFPPSMMGAGMPANTYGTANISSDQKLVVIVNDASASGKMDAAIYSGIKAD